MTDYERYEPMIRKYEAQVADYNKLVSLVRAYLGSTTAGREKELRTELVQLVGTDRDGRKT